MEESPAKLRRHRGVIPTQSGRSILRTQAVITARIKPEELVGIVTIADTVGALRRGETTSVALVDEAIARADRLDGRLGVYLSRFTDAARSAAIDADGRYASQAEPGPLLGIPLGIKDIITTVEGPTTAQSRVTDPIHLVGDAPVVARLRSAGGVVMGKTTTMEYAIGLPDPSAPFPIPRNPWDPARFAGGSSSGTAAGIAAGLFLGGLGTDTGGSVRWPAHCCGITGLKPTFGRVPKSGCVPLGFTYDHIGPMARTAEDCAILLGVMAGADEADPMSADVEVVDYAAALAPDLTGVTIGVDTLEAYANPEMFDPALLPLLAGAMDVLRSLGARVVDTSVPMFIELGAGASLGYLSEAFAYHRDALAARWSEYSPTGRLALASGALVSAGDYVQLQRVRRLGQRRLAERFDELDLIITPTSFVAAPRFDQLNLAALGGEFNMPYWTSAGNPVLTLPIGFNADGMPLSMQIAGRPFDELGVLSAGAAFQSRTEHHRRPLPTFPEE